MRLLLLLLPIFTFAQFQADYSYSTINIYDDFYNEQIQDAVIIGKSYDNLYSMAKLKALLNLILI